MFALVHSIWIENATFSAPAVASIPLDFGVVFDTLSFRRFQWPRHAHTRAPVHV